MADLDKPRAKPFQVSVANGSDGNVTLGGKKHIIKNRGSSAANVYIDFDRTTATGSSYYLEIGEAITVDWVVKELHHQGDGGTATLDVIRVEM